MHEGKHTVLGSITSMVAAEELEHWRQWLGSLAWDDLESRARLVILRAASTAPGVLDDENSRLLGRVTNSWRAFLLSRPPINEVGQSWLLSGDASAPEADSALLNVRTTSKLDSTIRPMHATRRKFSDIEADDFIKHWEAHGSRDDSWFERWIEIDRLLCEGKWSEILGHALLAHGSALTRQELEFSIPELVRAAEGVIALERRMGADVFKTRALRLAPALKTDRYVGGEIDTLLLELYQARSDCVHGKVPFLELRGQGDQGEERAAQLGYVADVLAREALLVALRWKDRSIFTSRETLEKAWASGTFP
jgi:hypothetical protein